MSGRIVHLEPDEHVAIQRLLPWYLSGTLGAQERATVDEHLSTCAECSAELEAERRWSLLQAGAGAGPGPDMEAGWAAMTARLAADAASARPAPMPPRAGTAAAAGGRRRRGFGWLPARPLARAWALPGVLSMALALALVVTLRPQPLPAGDYRALAAPQETVATAVVRFRPEATEMQIRNSLEQAGARLVDGPTVTAAYVVRLPRERYAAAVETLRRQPAVALVEALQASGPP